MATGGMQVEFANSFGRADDEDLEDAVEQVESIGRQFIVPHQNNIVITCKVNRRIFDERSVNVNPYYPLTAASKLSVLKGHVVCTGLPSAAGNQSAQPIGPDVWSAADGLSPGYFRALGVCRKGYVIDSMKDNAASVSISGVETIENTGGEKIRQGDLVIVDWPEIIDNDGKRVPRVNAEKGDNAFYMAVRPFRYGEVFQQFTEINREVIRKLKDNGYAQLDESASFGYKLSNADDENKVAEMLSLVKAIGDEFSPIRWANTDSDSPTNRYVKYLLYVMGAKSVTDWMRTKEEDTRRVVDQSIDGGVVIRHVRGARSRRVSQYGPKNPLQRVTFLTSFPLMMQNEQLNLYRRMFLGTALRDAAPGESFDINLGFGHM